MIPFRPAEIRIILILSILAIIASFLTIIQRQEKASRLNLGVLPEKSDYDYSYYVGNRTQQNDS